MNNLFQISDYAKLTTRFWVARKQLWYPIFCTEVNFWLPSWSEQILSVPFFWSFMTFQMTFQMIDVRFNRSWFKPRNPTRNLQAKHLNLNSMSWAFWSKESYILTISQRTHWFRLIHSLPVHEISGIIERTTSRYLCVLGGWRGIWQAKRKGRYSLVFYKLI